MRRTFGLPVGIALLAGALTWLIQGVLRPAMRAHPSALWLLGSAPNVVVGLCFPFIALGYPFGSFRRTQWAIAMTTGLTIGMLVVFEVWRPIRGAQTFDSFDILGSVLGGLVGGLGALALARREHSPIARRPTDR
jgi:hypothetical protein